MYIPDGEDGDDLLAEAKFDTVLKGSADYLEGKHTWEQRQQKLARLAHADRLHVLASVNTISEGVDVPTLDAVVFAAPKSSAVQVVQIVGRAIRLNP